MSEEFVIQSQPFIGQAELYYDIDDQPFEAVVRLGKLQEGLLLPVEEARSWAQALLCAAEEAERLTWLANKEETR